MKWYLRVIIFSAILAGIFFLVWNIRYVRDGLLWILLMYVIVGSVTGGTRILVARFTGKGNQPVQFQARPIMGYPNHMAHN